MGYSLDGMPVYRILFIEVIKIMLNILIYRKITKEIISILRCNFYLNEQLVGFWPESARCKQ